MKRMILFLSVVVIALALLPACASRAAELDRLETYPDGPIDLVMYYTSFEDLVHDAFLIVYAEAVDREIMMISDGKLLQPSQQSETSNGLEVPLDSIRVIACYKGDCKPDDTLTVMDWSGTVPSLQKGERYVLFLSPGGVENDPNALAVTGGFQGQFIERESLFIQQKTKEVRLTNFRPMKLDDLIQRIELAKKIQPPTT